MTKPIWIGKAKRLDDIDIPMIAMKIGCDEDRIHAVMDVEARGSGFDGKGRLAMLFEPHIFYDRLGPGAKRSRAIKAGLACKSWGQIAYPRDSYPRLEAAMAIDAKAALESCSWGLGQVMGFNYALAGYESAEAMVVAFAADEEHQLDGMVRFIKEKGLDDELRRLDWAGFALGYNGKGYKKHAYDIRLARAYAHWRKIKDTPWPPRRNA